ncbi:hypothetical protein B0T13DRAFT_474307 [Neurospora crassa]|nr:hypothetical protein B0T13DRAFT_474307 [Neurospora crassa]
MPWRPARACWAVAAVRAALHPVLPPTLGFGLRTEPLVWTVTSWGCCISISQRAQTRQKAERQLKRVLAFKPLPVACQLPAFVGSQGIF